MSNKSDGTAKRRFFVLEGVKPEHAEDTEIIMHEDAMLTQGVVIASQTIAMNPVKLQVENQGFNIVGVHEEQFIALQNAIATLQGFRRTYFSLKEVTNLTEEGVPQELREVNKRIN